MAKVKTKTKAKPKAKSRFKAFCPSCRKMTLPKVKGSLMWCGNCGDPID